MDDLTKSTGLQVAAMADPAEVEEGTSADTDTERQAAEEVVNEVKEHVGQNDNRLDNNEMYKDGKENQCGSREEESHKTRHEQTNENTDG